MNSLQLELDNINAQLELLTYRKTQLDSIMAEYSDVINRVKSLVDSMNDAMVEPSNLLMEIEGIVYGEPEPKTDNYDARFNQLCDESEAYAEAFLKEHPELLEEPEPTPEEQEPTAEPTLNNLGLPITTPETVKLMACVPTVAVPTPSEIIDDGVEQEEFLSYVKKHQATPTPTPKTQLNEKAYRRNDTLLIGFDNKRLMISWAKWFNESFNGAVFVKDDENLEGFKYCLSVLWYGSDISTNWERLSALNYSFKPDEQPTGIKLDDVRDAIQKLQSNGVKFISKGELLAHHFNSLKPSELEQHLEQLMNEGLIALGNKSIDLLPAKTQDNEPENPTFEYTEIDSKTTKIYNDGMLLGIAKNCGTHWESPQLPGQTFPNRRDVVAGLWQLVNQF